MKFERVRFLPDPQLPELGQAVSLALAIMRNSKVVCWSDLDNLVPYRVELLDGQLELLRRFLPELSYLRSSGKDESGAPIPTVTMALCDVCGCWVLLGSGSAPKVCTLTFGCTGRPTKISPAGRTNGAAPHTTSETEKENTDAEPPVTLT